MEGFYTQEDIWRLNEEVKVIRAEQVQHARQLGQHSDRLSRLERRGDDAKIRSLWTSCFPPVQTGSNFPQLNPSFQTDTSLDAFDGFDGQQQHTLVAGLPLDEVDVPRRGASRANSVRFDESAIQNHWTPESNVSNDYFPHRTNSMGGHLMTERSSSFKSDYKSEGRQSSVRSMRSFDNYSMVDSEAGVPLPSSQSVLESRPTSASATPPVIRCWLGKAFSCETILYAVICTGSSKSLIDKSLVSRSGLSEMVWQENGQNRVSLSLYLADALVPPERIASSNTLPRLKGEFVVVDIPENAENPNTIGIVLGSDILSAIQADVMFSKGQMNFLVTDGRTVQVDFAHLGPKVQYPGFCMMDAVGAHLPGFAHTSNLSQESAIKTMAPTATDGPSNPPTQKLQQSALNQETGSQQKSSEESAQQPTSETSHSRNSVEGLNEVFQTSTINDSPEVWDGRTSQLSERARSKNFGNLNGKQNSPAVEKSREKDGRSVWESWRKSSDTSTMEKTTSEGGSSQKPARTMKVLRPSKSAASSISGAQNKEENSSPKSVSSNKHTLAQKSNGPKPTSFSQQHSQTSSTANSPKPAPTKSRSSTNVVGGASAFHWMNQRYD